jgi:signal transduction histidine kinase/FixJ family two-component response regulator
MGGVPDGEAVSEIERLRRRLEQETAARREAERVAKTGLRDLWDRQRSLVLLESIADTANQSSSSAKAFARAIKEVCAFTGWPLGHVYVTRRRSAGPYMASARIWWEAEGRRYGDFRRVSETMVFEAGWGLPGRVLASGAPAWISRLDLDPRFPRGPTATQVGLSSGFAFPVLVRAHVVAVMEFFTAQVQEPDDELLALMAQVGAQLGRAVERERSHQRLQEKNQRLRALVRRAEEARSAAEAASRAKSAFLAVTSHEVRTPLNVVLGLAEALRREALTRRQDDLVEGILDSGAMLLRLLNAVLDLSKIEAGEGALDLRPAALDENLATIVRVWDAKARELGLTLSLDVSGLQAPACIMADAGKIEQCLVNLVSNAMKFTPRGGAIRITAKSLAHGERRDVELMVDDDGPGVPEADRERILRPYVQTDSGKAAGGAGLGLSICAGHMALMAGSISVGSSPSGGARFVLKFSAEAARSADRGAPALSVPVEATGLRMLIAEDNPANRRVLQVLLEPLGPDISFAVNGLEAVQAVEREIFHLVLMDAQMPVMDGVEAVKAIRRLPTASASVPIHMLTANVFDEDVRGYLAAGADGVLAKPVQLEKIYSVLADVAASKARAAGASSSNRSIRASAPSSAGGTSV